MSIVVESVLKFIYIFKNFSGSLCNAVEWIFGDKYRHTGFTADKLVKSSQQRSAAGQSYSLIYNIR